MPINYDELGNVINATNPSATETATAEKYAAPSNVVRSGNSDAGQGQSSSQFASIDPRRVDLTPELGERLIPGVPPGAEPAPVQRPDVNFVDINGNSSMEDMRVRILVPPKYITSLVLGPNDAVAKNGGILFPYTPSISYELKADYSSMQPLHSNFPINFYQKSSVGNISISGKFSVESADDADMYISTTHLLKALTRMRSGGNQSGAGRGATFSDPDSGAPPPVCRLFAHGEMMLHNVPVAISSYRIELPDSVDYFTLGGNSAYGTTSVPTISTIAITCIPMYSRSEMQRFSVTGYMNDNQWYKKQGFI